MKPKLKRQYESLSTIQERAAWLLKQGVQGKLMMRVGSIYYAATAADVLIPCGDFETAAQAVAAGAEWLAEKAKSSEENAAPSRPEPLKEANDEL